MSAINYDPRSSIDDENTFATQVLKRKPGGDHRNVDWDAQEVMTGASRADWVKYRALWFSMLSQDYLRTGTANSDTHSLSLEQVGYPRNLVFGKEPGPGEDAFTMFTRESFDADIRAGHVVGTNGPVLDVWIEDGDKRIRPSLERQAAIHLTETMLLHIEVSGAPWIPAEEVRVIVNGTVVRNPSQEIGDATDMIAHDPFSTEPWRVVLKPMIVEQLMATPASPQDAWIVVEAGMKLEESEIADADNDGLPDLVSSRPPPVSMDYIQAIAPGVWPVAFSNPFLIDRDGNGWTAPGLL
jgi:hypothetical protein